MREKLLKILLTFVITLGAISGFATGNVSAKTKTYSAKVNTTVLNVRQKPTVNSKKLGTLKKNTKVTVYLKNKKGWATISFNKKKAYVSAKYLSYSKKYVSYKRNKNRVYKFKNVYEGNTTYYTAKYIKTTTKGDVWSDETIWKETSKGLKIDLQGIPVYIKYPIKEGNKWSDGQGTTAIISGVNGTYKAHGFDFKNLISVDQGYQILSLKSGVGIVSYINNRNAYYDLISIKVR